METQITDFSSRQTDQFQNRKSILVIDDNEDLLEINRIYLESAGYEVATASSGKEAFEILGHGSPFDLILLDMYMGDMQGIEFIRQLEFRLPEIFNQVPIVFLTGADSVPASKARGFLRKPIDMNQLIESVRTFTE